MKTLGLRRLGRNPLATPVVLSAAMALSSASCKHPVAPSDPNTPSVSIPGPASGAPASDEAPPSTAKARVIEDDAPLEPGFVVFTGMARPTKGGIDVRGVTIAVERLSGALPPRGETPWSMDDLLGARLRIEAELVAWHHDAEPSAVAVQSRSGDGFSVRELVNASVVSRAIVIEGEISRSKGLYQVGDYLVSREDLGWSLAHQGSKVEGLRVRLWGQPRTVVCEPGSQCLISGQLPLFDVGQAEVLK